MTEAPKIDLDKVYEQLGQVPSEKPNTAAAKPSPVKPPKQDIHLTEKTKPA